MLKRGMVRGAGTTGSALGFAGPRQSVMIGESISYTGDAAGTLSFYRAKQKTTAAAALSADVSLSIDTDSLGYVGGAVLTTSDYVIIADSSGTGMQLRAISGVGAVASSVVILTIASATCADADVIYVVRAADIHSITTAAETKLNLLNMWNSYPDMPVAIELTGSTGSKFFSGTYTVED